MPNVDGFAPSEILHLPPSQTSRSDGADLASVPHGDLIAWPDLMRRVPDSDREDVAHRKKVFDLDPVGVLLRKDLTTRQGQGEHAPRGVHRELLSSSEHTDIGKTTPKCRSFDEGRSCIAELEAGEVRHLFGEAGSLRHGSDGTRDLIERTGQRDERVLGGRMVLRAEDSLGYGL